MTGNTARPPARQILRAAVEDGGTELRRSPTALAFSGFAAGFTMGLSGLGVAAVMFASDGHAGKLVAATLYPSGFVAVIIGRAQLFTENTLYPIAVVLQERRHFALTARMWGVVILTNVLGAAAFAALVTKTSALPPKFAEAFVGLGQDAVSGSLGHIFWSAVIAGWLIALVAWLVSASRSTSAQVLVIWILAFVVGLGEFAHSIATSCEILCAVFGGAVPPLHYLGWLVAAVGGNAVGGVTIVALLNYGQVFAGV